MRNDTDLRANLVLITYDQWRGDWCDLLEPIVDLPNLRTLAENSWIAQRCYTSSPQCVPARLSWITGIAPSRVGITKNEPVDLPGKAPSIIRNLKKRGWTTGLVGKTHWSNHNQIANLEDNKGRLEELGFMKTIEIAGPRALQKIDCEITKDWHAAGVYEKHMKDLKERYKFGRSRESWKVKETVLPLELYPDVWVANKGIKMLEEMPEDKPWLLWISFVGPHEPFDTPEPWKGTHKNIKLPEKIINNGWIDRLNDECSMKKVKMTWDHKLKEEDIVDLRRDYADHLCLLDEQTGRILKALNNRKDGNNSAVVITADHGEMLGDHGMLYKSTFLEQSVRVPFIYRPPNSNYKEQKSTKCALGVTKLLKKVTDNLEEGGKVGPIIEWSNKQKGAISEFENETMFVRNDNKMVYDNDGTLLWQTNMKDDPDEKMNTLETGKGENRKTEEQKEINEWAQKRLKKKRKGNWIKIHL